MAPTSLFSAPLLRLGKRRSGAEKSDVGATGATQNHKLKCNFTEKMQKKYFFLKKAFILEMSIFMIFIMLKNCTVRKIFMKKSKILAKKRLFLSIVYNKNFQDLKCFHRFVKYHC